MKRCAPLRSTCSLPASYCIFTDNSYICNMRKYLHIGTEPVFFSGEGCNSFSFIALRTSF